MSIKNIIGATIIFILVCWTIGDMYKDFYAEVGHWAILLVPAVIALFVGFCAVMGWLME